MLELADNDFKVAIIITFNNIKESMLVMHKNKENLSREIENIKKSQMEILVLKI